MADPPSNRLDGRLPRSTNRQPCAGHGGQPPANAILRLGVLNCTTGSPWVAATRVFPPAVDTWASIADPTWSFGSSASTAVPAAAICGVKPTNVSVELFSDEPVLPATGRLPIIEPTIV